MPTRRSAAAAAKAEAESASSSISKATSRAAVKAESVQDLALEKTQGVRAVVNNAATKKSKIPAWAQFPLAATLSFAMASLGYSLLGEVTKGELASVSRSQDTWTEVGVLASWRLVELALGWYGQLDSFDVAALDLLSHGPSLYLLTAFYTLSPSTAIASLVVDILSAAVPFFLLRPIAAVHTPGSALPNRELIDPVLQTITSLLSATIYCVTIVLSLRMLLPRVLVVYFTGLPSLEPAYAASYVGMIPVAVAFGIAANTLIYAPFATTGKAENDDKIGDFDPASATLKETVEWNVMGYTAKTQVVVARTAIACFVTAVNTYLACTMTIYGIESTGAAAYAGVWVLAALASGLGLGLVGQ